MAKSLEAAIKEIQSGNQPAWTTEGLAAELSRRGQMKGTDWPAFLKEVRSELRALGMADASGNLTSPVNRATPSLPSGLSRERVAQVVDELLATNGRARGASKQDVKMAMGDSFESYGLSSERRKQLVDSQLSYGNPTAVRSEADTARLRALHKRGSAILMELKSDERWRLGGLLCRLGRVIANSGMACSPRFIEDVEGAILGAEARLGRRAG